jgi:hypothetical protein
MFIHFLIYTNKMIILLNSLSFLSHKSANISKYLAKISITSHPKSSYFCNNSNK